jgi:MGT family glycosyltransferase
MARRHRPAARARHLLDAVPERPTTRRGRLPGVRRRAVDVVITTADIDPATLNPPANVRVERFVPHSPVLDRAACVVCHAGMGITQKALAHGVPVVAVPFGRDQPEVARRVEVAQAGIRLPARRLDPARLRGAVKHAMHLTAGAQRIAAAFNAAGGPAAAADALEQLTHAATTAAPS